MLTLFLLFKLLLLIIAKCVSECTTKIDLQLLENIKMRIKVGILSYKGIEGKTGIKMRGHLFTQGERKC